MIKIFGKEYSVLLIMLGSFILTCIEISAKPVYARQTGIADTSVLKLADPTIFYHNGTYYLYGTGGDVNKGFLVYTSSDLRLWQGPKGVHDGYALVKDDTYGTAGFWAPQVFHYKGKFYMAYTANENIAIAVSDSPLGPFKQQVKKQVSEDGKQIDPYVFFDDNGKKYLYHVRLVEGNRIFVAELKNDLSDIVPGTIRPCLSATEQWENTANAQWPVAEGPTVLKHKGLYYLFYSANDFRNIDYSVGYAVSKSPVGPWKKYEHNPMISRRSIGINGTGHGDFLKDKNGKLLYVFHTHTSDKNIQPRLTGLIEAAFTKGSAGQDKMVIGQNTFRYLNLQEQADNHFAVIRNPVLNSDFPDPTVIYADGKYYAYATQTRLNGKTINIQVASSADLQNWSIESDALPQKPVWAKSTQDFWAPHVLYDEDIKKYVMFYSGESDDTATGKCLGVAYSDRPGGPFIDKGTPLLCGEDFVNIDPMAFVDPQTGKKLLYWGSGFHPVKVQEMTHDWKDFKPRTFALPIVWPGKEKEYTRLIEGPWIDYHDKNYYLYYSGDNCCGEKASYAVMVAKADNALGPFVSLGEANKSGKSTILEKDKEWNAPGHNSIFKDNKGNSWIAYHAIWTGNDKPGIKKGRLMCILPIQYNNGWPEVLNSK
jgi:arabinan endo-1,5-alpha-L-arabinosidase